MHKLVLLPSQNGPLESYAVGAYLEPIVPVSHECIPNSHCSSRERSLEPQMSLFPEHMFRQMFLLYRIVLWISMSKDVRMYETTYNGVAWANDFGLVHEKLYCLSCTSRRFQTTFKLYA